MWFNCCIYTVECYKCLITSSLQNKTKKSLICCLCQFPWHIYTTALIDVLNTELGRTGTMSSSTPLGMSITHNSSKSRTCFAHPLDGDLFKKSTLLRYDSHTITGTSNISICLVLERYTPEWPLSQARYRTSSSWKKKKKELHHPENFLCVLNPTALDPGSRKLQNSFLCRLDLCSLQFHIY